MNVDVLDSAAQKVTAVPTTSIGTVEGSPHLFVEEAGGRFQPLAITTGESSQSFTEVTTVLPTNARIVVKGASLLLAAWEERAAE